MQQLGRLTKGAQLGLAARDLGGIDRLIKVAEGPLGPRSELYEAVASLYRLQGARLAERERRLMRDILRRLTSDVEMAVRVAVAEKIAEDPDAPLDLILFLIDDRIEVARPLILRSTRFSDDDLLAFIAHADLARQALCAERANIGERVTEELSKCEAEPILLALARNTTARFTAAALSRLVEKSRFLEPLREPLAHRPDLPPILAQKMCAWVSEAIREHIGRHYGIEAEKLDAALRRANHAVQSSATADAEESSFRLIDKLAAAGQLKPGFLIRVLHQGQLDLFEIGFARLLEIHYAQIRAVLYEGGPRTVAMACRAVGIDRCVFPAVYNLSRQGRRIHPLLNADDRADAEAVFSSYSKAEALARLQAGHG